MLGPKHLIVENTWDDAQNGETLRVELTLRGDDVLVAKVRPLLPEAGQGLHPAVFSFRPGDPQYASWRRRWQEAGLSDPIRI